MCFGFLDLYFNSSYCNKQEQLRILAEVCNQYLFFGFASSTLGTPKSVSGNKRLLELHKFQILIQVKHRDEYKFLIYRALLLKLLPDAYLL